MRLSTLCMTAALALGSIGLACANPVNLIQNGDFSQTQTPAGASAIDTGAPSQLNYAPYGYLFQPSYGEFVTDWTTTGPLLSQHVVWFPSASAAAGTKASDIDTTLFGVPVRALLPSSVTDAPGGSFVGLQVNLPDSGIQQTIGGLTSGKTYAVSFYWAATQDNIDTGTTTSGFKVSIAGKTFDTGLQTVTGSCDDLFCTKHSTTFAGWTPESFTFVADSASAILTFLGQGSGFGLPPFALLGDVSLTAVPEPPVLATFGSGLLGLGLLALYTRRRARHQPDDVSEAA